MRGSRGSGTVDSCLMSEPPGDRDHPVSERTIERAIILHLLEAEDGPGPSPAALAAALGFGSGTVEGALGRLSEAGVLAVVEGAASVSEAVRRIDELGLIGI